MDLENSLEEMFQWQTPFCCTSLNVIVGSEVVIPSLDAMLVDIELPEIIAVSEQAAASCSEPLSIPLSPSNSITTTPVVSSAIEASVSIRNPLTVNTKLSCVQKGTRGFEILAPTSPLSSTPNTPPVVKPTTSRGSGPTTSKSVVPKAKKGPAVFRLDAAEPKSKETRLPTKKEHIIRERQRRDDMAAKYATLESLLPPASKRERTAVVEDAISFVEALQQKKAQLQKRSDDLKHKASCNQSPWGKKSRSLAALHQSLWTVVNPSPCIPKKPRSAMENCKSDSLLSASSNGVIVHADAVLVTSDRAATGPHASAISAINVHLEEEQIVIDTVWRRPGPSFQSTLLLAVESLGFDVTKCCIFRVGNGYIQCVITCTKLQGLSQRISEIQSSSTMIIRALRHMLSLTD